MLLVKVWTGKKECLNLVAVDSSDKGPQPTQSAGSTERKSAGRLIPYFSLQREVQSWIRMSGNKEGKR